MHLCASFDVGEAFWAAMVSQGVDEELGKSVHGQRREPPAFLRRRFENTQEQ